MMRSTKTPPGLRVGTLVTGLVSGFPGLFVAWKVTSVGSTARHSLLGRTTNG
jgi:hypothetical protein